MTNKRKHVGNILFLLAVFSITLYYVFHGQDMRQVFQYVRQSDIRYWGFSVVCVILFILSESVIIYYMMRTIGQAIRLPHCFLYSFVGFFFSCITPSASGGQPAQIYFMKKHRLSVSLSTLILMLVTITYKAVLVLLGVFVLVIRPPIIMQYLSPVWGWCLLGIALNVFCVVFMMTLVFHPTLAVKLLVRLTRQCGTLFRLKQNEARIERVQRSMQKYRDAAVYLREHKLVIVNVLLITVVQRFLLFFVTYLTYRSFGFHGLGFLTVSVLQGMISVSVDMLPLPGGMGISERLFLKIFAPIFGAELTIPAMVVSRGLGFYTELLISAVMTMVAFFVIRGTAGPYAAKAEIQMKKGDIL